MHITRNSHDAELIAKAIDLAMPELTYRWEYPTSDEQFARITREIERLRAIRGMLIDPNLEPM